MKKFNENAVIFLPTTEKAFDELIKSLVKNYRLPSIEHASAVVANRIQHLPPDQATTTLKYLGHCVLKNIAYQVAQAKAHKAQHEMQVDELMASLKANPNDNQARDHLTRAASEGSEYAKAAIARLEPPTESGNVIGMIKPQIGVEAATSVTAPDSA